MTKNTKTRLYHHVKPLDIIGAAQLSAQGTADVITVTEHLHLSILSHLGMAPDGPLSIVGKTTQYIYRSIRFAPNALATSLGPLSKLLPSSLTDNRAHQNTLQRKQTIAALNGIIGDKLKSTHNPLAQSLKIIEPTTTYSEQNTILFLHGLCMDDSAWTENEEHHGMALDIANALQAKPLLITYNTGLSIAENGSNIANALKVWVAKQEQPVHNLKIVGHSMGGLVARSALHFAKTNHHSWLKKVSHLITLGSPHMGAPLENVGHWIENLLAKHPYTQPFIRLTQNRSNGIKDLKQGRVTQEKHAIPLPDDIACFAIAGQLQTRTHTQVDELLGDGLVTVKSAFGHSESTSEHLNYNADHTWIAPGVNHLNLLDDENIKQKIIQWLNL